MLSHLVGLLAVVSSASLSLADSSTFQAVHQPLAALWDDQGALHTSMLKNRFDAFDDQEADLIGGDGAHQTILFRRQVQTCGNGTSGRQTHKKKHKKKHRSKKHHVHPWIHDKGLGVIIAKSVDDSADNEWLVNVGFGTPVQTLQVVFDSGSSDAWTYSPQCCYTNNHTFFDPTKSSTFSNRTLDQQGRPQRAPNGTPGQRFNNMYGSGSTTEGYVGIDTITLFGQPTKHSHRKTSLAIPDLPVGLATSLPTGSRSKRGMDGLVGLSPGIGSHTSGNWTTVLEAMSSRHLIDKNYLSITLTESDLKTGKGGGGNFTFGQLDTTHLKGNLTWTNVLSPFYWASYFDKMSMGNLTLAQKPATSARPIRYMIDTGSAVNYFPNQFLVPIHSQIAGSLRTSSNQSALPWLIPCDTGLPEYESKLLKPNPTFSITIEGKTFYMPKSDLVFYRPYPVPPSHANGQSNMCYSVFQPGTDGISMIGLAFIKSHLIVLDQGNSSSNFENRRMAFGRRSDIDYHS